MDKEYTRGKMGEGMKGNTSKIKSMATEYMCGQMAGDTKATGSTASSTEREDTYCPMERRK